MKDSSIYELVHINKQLVKFGPEVPPNAVMLRPPVGADDLARIMRDHDCLLFPALNEACPNVVLEALASGLPILYAMSGGTHEIVGDAGLPLSDDLGADLENIRQRLPELREAAINSRARISIERTAGQYATYFSTLLEKR